MNIFSLLNFFSVFLLIGVVINVVAGDTKFEDIYNITWGNDHVLLLNQGKEVQLSMDQNSGAGFGSKLSYGSGFFHMNIKLPNRDSAGVVTAFYLTSHTKRHDEIDFEFLGNREGKPITLQTNVYAYGQGGREQRTLLWFDPTADFHTYAILWNEYHIVFYVDEIPIRVFKDNRHLGVRYPTQPMQIRVSLWDGESWATDGGRSKTNWSFAPFKAYFNGFNVEGCSLGQTSGNVESCYSSGDSAYWWNARKYWRLNHIEQEEYEHVRQKYLNYDYCTDRERYPTPPPECASNS